MKIGALLGPVIDGSDHRFLAEQARRYQAAGYSSLWSAQAVGRGMMLTDPFTALATAATAAPEVEIGTAVLQLPLYHPMDLAHRVFSLQQISGSRLILGVGAGSTEQDFAAYERDYAARFADYDRGLQALRGIFLNGSGAHGDLSPWPAVEGGPPIYFGTWGKQVVQAAKEYEGWIASGHYRTVDQVCEALAVYRGAGGGRAIVSTLQVNGKTDLGELQTKLVRFREAGFDDAVVMCSPGAPDPELLAKMVLG